MTFDEAVQRAMTRIEREENELGQRIARELAHRERCSNILDEFRSNIGKRAAELLNGSSATELYFVNGYGWLIHRATSLYLNSEGALCKKGPTFKGGKLTGEELSTSTALDELASMGSIHSLRLAHDHGDWCGGCIVVNWIDHTDRMQDAVVEELLAEFVARSLKS